MRYVSLGDSSGVGIGADSGGGYPHRLAKRLRDHGVVVQHTNLAESGAQAKDVLRNQVQACARLKPDLVTVGIGGNDLWQLVPVATFQQQLQQIVDALAIDDVDVVFLNIVDLSLAPIAAMAERYVQVTREQIVGRVESLNAVMADVVHRANAAALAARRNSNFVVVDVCSASRAEIIGHPEFFAGDGFHPSARGYERFTELLWPVVSFALQRRGRLASERLRGVPDKERSL